MQRDKTKRLNAHHEKLDRLTLHVQLESQMTRTATAKTFKSLIAVVGAAVLAMGTVACDQDIGGPLIEEPIAEGEGEGEVECKNDDPDCQEPVGEGEGEGEGEGPIEPPPPPPPTLEESVQGELIWKRYRALEQDLMRSLELQSSQVCQELGQFSCVDEVHLAALGGNEPFDKSQYEPSREPTATSSIATDRVVLSACARRAELDRNGTPQVFTDIDLNAPTASDAQADAVSTQLFRRMLARDPTGEELVEMRKLTSGPSDMPVSASEFAILACFTVGTHVESLFF